MTRYYFHLETGDERIVDQEGVDLADGAAIAREASQALREIFAEDIRFGRVNLAMRLEVEDHAARRVHVVSCHDLLANSSGVAS